MTRPTRDQMLMRQAQIVAERSTCARAHVGVVIAHDGRVVSQGYNGAPAGMAHCDHTCPCTRGFEDDPGPGEIPLHTDGCPMKPCTRAVHGEANAIAFAARHGVATNGATLFTTLAPCPACAQLIINAGIVRVVFAKPYRFDAGINLLMDAGVPTEFAG
jgi:dCMP deaminase